MATAGSGDVLTGIITGFLAQTSDPFIFGALWNVYPWSGRRYGRE